MAKERTEQRKKGVKVSMKWLVVISANGWDLVIGTWNPPIRLAFPHLEGAATFLDHHMEQNNQQPMAV